MFLSYPWTRPSISVVHVRSYVPGVPVLSLSIRSCISAVPVLFESTPKLVTQRCREAAVAWLAETRAVVCRDGADERCGPATLAHDADADFRFLLTAVGIECAPSEKDIPSDFAKRSFLRLCSRGSQRAASWLADRFALSGEDARADDNSAFRLACSNGHLSVSQWLADRFALSGEDARAENNAAFREACSNGI